MNWQIVRETINTLRLSYFGIELECALRDHAESSFNHGDMTAWHMFIVAADMLTPPDENGIGIMVIFYDRVNHGANPYN